MTDLLASYAIYLDIEEQVAFTVKVFEKLAIFEVFSKDQLFQTCVDEVFSDEEREAWRKWAPGGTATAEEWLIIRKAFER